MIKEVINKAIEGGWNSEECSPPVGSRDRFDYAKMYLDPVFWQSLGKTLGWKLKKDLMISHDTVFMMGNKSLDEWQHRWLVFTLHLSENKDPNEFFEEILKK